MTVDRSDLVGRSRHVARWALAGFLVVAGIGHFVVHEAFLAQVPSWLPAPRWVVWSSGVVEVALGAALVLTRRRRRELGWVVAAFFVAVLPGNVHQALSGADAFGLDTPEARWTRLLFQPLLIAWAIWSTRGDPHHGPGGGASGPDDAADPAPPGAGQE